MQPAKLFFLIEAPNTKDNVHLDVLAQLSILLMDDDFRTNLMNAKSVKEFLQIIDDAESDKRAEVKEESADGYAVLAVTACPTSIAHTYMAAEALEQAGKKLNIAIKVETDGSGRAKNVLTAEEIQKAKCIILATDTKVPTARFEGKKVIQVKVADGIHKAEELITRANNGEEEIYHEAGNSNAKKEEEEKGGIGHQIYKHLMSGVSHMLPFVIGGGILTALAFLIDTICGYGGAASGNFGSITPLAAFFKTIGGLAMGLMGEIRKIEVPGNADRFDHRCHDHYHARCLKCGKVFDVEMDYIKDLEKQIKDAHGFQFSGHDLMFKGVCPDCQKKEK